MKMAYRWLSLLCFVCLTACGGTTALNVTPTPTPAPTLVPAAIIVPTSAPIPVMLTVAYPDHLAATYTTLAAAFHQTYPHITVQLAALSALQGSVQDTREQPIARAQAVLAHADVAPSEVASTAVISSGLLRDVVPLMMTGPALDRDAWYPGMLQRAQVGDAIYVLPRTLTVPLLSVNTNLVANSEPTPAWTWADLLQAAEHATTMHSAGMLDPSQGLLPLLAVMQQRQVRVDDPRAFQVDTSALLPVLAQLRDIAARRVVVDAVRAPTAVQDATVAFWLDAPNAGMDQRPTVHTVLAPLLAGPDDNVIDGAVMSSGTTHPREAWLWLEYLTRQPFPADNLAGHLPARAALAAQSRAWGQINTEGQAALLAALANPVGWSPWWTKPGAGPLVNTLTYIGAHLDPATATHDMMLLQAAEKRRVTQQQQVSIPALLTPVAVVPATPVAPSAATTTITFGVLGSDTADLAPLVAAFTATHPAIAISLFSTLPISAPRTIAQMATRTDCFAADQLPGDAADEAALLDLAPVMRDDTTFPHNDLPRALDEVYARGDRRLGLPYAWQLPAIRYNRTLLTSAHQSPPLATWSSRTFAQAAQALTHPGTADHAQYGYVPLDTTADLGFFLRRAGIHLTTGTGAAARPAFTDPAVFAAVQDYGTLLQRTAPPSGANAPSSAAVFAGGRGALWLDVGGQGNASDAPAGDISAAGLPSPTFAIGVAAPPLGGAAARTDDLAIHTLHISAGGHAPAACWAWLRYLSEQPSFIGGDLPARTTLATSAAWEQQAEPASVARYQTLVPLLAQPLAAGDARNVPLTWLWEELDQVHVTASATDLRAALASAQLHTEAYLTCVAQGIDTNVCAQR